MLELTTKAAVMKVLNEKKVSAYRLAKNIGVTPNMISNYLTGSRMRQNTANKFADKYDIIITDVYVGRYGV